MKHLFLALAAFVFMSPVTAPGTAQAQDARPSALKATPADNGVVAAPAAAIGDQAAIIAKAERYLQNLKTGKARFLQTTGNGNQAIGTFYISRPGKLRFEYDPPVKDFVVADGYFIYFYDSQLKEQSNAPIGQTMADFLLRDNLRLSGDVRVTEVKQAGELIQISLVQSSDPSAGKLTLGFTPEPFALKKWRVTDSQSNITEVELFQLQTGVNLTKSLFVYSNPNRLEDRKRFNE